ncbi:hypothetical protein FEM48_ZijujUnG0114200 [Ziziphus jujuba var. spinosa]|uniref:Protein SLOW GREEN 1, chloroplastic n=1 Tax=Ziziphus jujuba var. spinosa TaxID=714518 RepID=A0A978U7Z2_ZIZJJ|nr:hypothetical protein FEM48_ZijujUnG0114200 [Ziziphus jujuba var. spinosa]
MNSPTLPKSSSTSPSSLFHFNSLSSLTPRKPLPPLNLRFAPQHPRYPLHVPTLKLRASSSSHSEPSSNGRTRHPIVPILQRYAKAAIFIAAGAAMVVKSSYLPAIAEPPAAVAEKLDEQDQEEDPVQKPASSPLSEFLESNSEAIEALKSLLQQKLENGEDEEALKIVKRLVSAQPESNEWKFLMARLLSEMGETESARHVFEEILERNPLSFEALFENALLMDRRGEGEDVIKRLEEALRTAEEEHKAKEARDVKLIIAQIQFLQKNVEEALKIYQELLKEDPNDFRPYFCRGMIYSLLDRNVEAREQFEKYRQLSPKKFEVEGYLRTPLSRMKLFGTDEN